MSPTILEYTAGQGTAGTRFLQRTSLAVLAGIFGYLLIYHLHHEGRDHGHFGDFPTFYQAAQYAREHRDIYTAGRAESDQMYVYPPLIAFLYIPFTYLALPDAAMVMLSLTALMLLASLLLCARAMLARFDAHSSLALYPVACFVAILSENESRGVMTMLETDALMLLLFTLALLWVDRRPALAGLTLAVGFNIKYLSIVTLPYLLLRRRWKAAASLVLGSGFFALLPALQLGWHEDLRCLRVSMGGLLRWVGVAPEKSGAIVVHDLADTLSMSITSGLARVLGARGFSNPNVIAASASVGLLSLAVIAILYRKNHLPLFAWPSASLQQGQPFKGLVALEWAGLIAVTLAFSPNTNARHLVLTVLVYSAAAALLLSPRPSVPRAPALTGALLLFLGHIMPGGKALRYAGLKHYFYGGPCWCLLIGYLLVLWTGLRFIHAGMARGLDASRSRAGN